MGRKKLDNYKRMFQLIEGKDVIIKHRSKYEYYYQFYSCEQFGYKSIKVIYDSFFYKSEGQVNSLTYCLKDTLCKLPEWVDVGYQIILFMKEEDIGNINNFYSPSMNILVFSSIKKTRYTIIDRKVLNLNIHGEEIKSCYYKNPTQFSGDFNTVNDFLEYNHISPYDIETGLRLN